MKHSARFFLPFCGWILISTILLTLPGSAFPNEDWFSKIWFDKWIHIGMFAIMTFLLCFGFVKKPVGIQNRARYFIYAALICLSYGIIMEFIQKNFVPNRSFDTGDIVADAIGSFIGAWFSGRVYKKK